MPPAGLPNATRPGPRGRPTAGPSDPLWSEEIVVGDGQKTGNGFMPSQAKLRPSLPAQSGVTLHANATLVKLNKGRKISIVHARLKKCAHSYS